MDATHENRLKHPLLLVAVEAAFHSPTGLHRPRSSQDLAAAVSIHPLLLLPSGPLLLASRYKYAFSSILEKLPFILSFPLVFPVPLSPSHSHSTLLQSALCPHHYMRWLLSTSPVIYILPKPKVNSQASFTLSLCHLTSEWSLGHFLLEKLCFLDFSDATFPASPSHWLLLLWPLPFHLLLHHL